MRQYLAIFLIIAGAHEANAAPLTAGSFLVSDEVYSTHGRIREFTTAGTLLQTITFTANDQPRDIAVDANRNVEVYDGGPRLTAINPSSGATIATTTVDGWSTENGLTFGGLATFRNFVFATDMSTANGGEPNGIIRFDINTHAATRFASSESYGFSDYIDLNMGMDGLLYALYPDGVNGVNVNQIDVYDPLTLAFVRRVNMPTNLRSIAVDSNGDIFAGSTNDDEVHHFDRNGIELSATSVDVGFTDIDIDRAGRIVLASGAYVVLTNRSLITLTKYHVNTTSPGNTIFVTWVDVPEPTTATLLAVVVAVACFGRRRPTSHNRS